MSVDYTNGSNGTLCTYAFQENGDQIPVTRGNVHLYVQYMVQFYLQDSIKQACAWIEMGLRDVLGRMDFSLFDGVPLHNRINHSFRFNYYCVERMLRLVLRICMHMLILLIQKQMMNTKTSSGQLWNPYQVKKRQTSYCLLRELADPL